MRIVHTDTDDIENPLGGGQPVRTWQVNSRLSSRHDITVFTATYPGALRRLHRGNVAYRRLGLRIPGLGLSPHLSFLAALGPAVRLHPADLIVEEFTPPVGFCLLPWWSDRPIVSLVQWHFFSDWEKRYKLPFTSIMEKIAARGRYRNFIVQTEAMAHRFRQLIPDARVWTVPCGVDDDAFTEPQGDGEYALFLGRLDISHKGLDLLVAVWKHLADSGIVVPLLVAGEGPGRVPLQQMIDEAGLGEKIRLLGRVAGERKRNLLQRARLLVMPSRQETFGITALESMAAGRPVVCFNIEHLNEVVQRQYGILVPPFDCAAMAEAVAALWTGPERARELGMRARLAAGQYRWDEIAIRQEKVYQEVVKEWKS